MIGSVLQFILIVGFLSLASCGDVLAGEVMMAGSVFSSQVKSDRLAVKLIFSTFASMLIKYVIHTQYVLRDFWIISLMWVCMCSQSGCLERRRTLSLLGGLSRDGESLREVDMSEVK